MSKKLFSSEPVDVEDAVVVSDVEESPEVSPPSQDDTLAMLNQKNLFKDIGDIMSKTNAVSNESPKVIKYFVQSSNSGSKTTASLSICVIEIDSNHLFPNTNILLNPSQFVELYTKQLEDIIFSNDGKADASKLIDIIQIYGLILRKTYPIKLKSSKLNKYLGKISYTLNLFFNDNLKIINSIYVMFNSKVEADAAEGVNKKES